MHWYIPTCVLPQPGCLILLPLCLDLWKWGYVGHMDAFPSLFHNLQEYPKTYFALHWLVGTMSCCHGNVWLSTVAWGRQLSDWQHHVIAVPTNSGAGMGNASAERVVAIADMTAQMALTNLIVVSSCALTGDSKIRKCLRCLFINLASIIFTASLIVIKTILELFIFERWRRNWSLIWKHWHLSF